MFRLVVFLLPYVLVASVVLGKSSADCQYSLTLEKTRFSEHEPILLTLVIANSSYEPLPVSLGYDREGAFIFTVKLPDGSVKELPRKQVREGLSRLGSFDVGPQQTYTQQLILNEWYDFSDPGLYEITARLMKGRGQAEAGCLNTSFGINVIPFDIIQVQATCGGLVATIRENINDVGKAFDAAKALLAVKHPVVVPFLGQALKANHAVSSYVIPGLEEIGNDEAVRILIPLLDTFDPENDEFLLARRALLVIEKKTTDPATLDLVKRALAKVRQ